MYSYPLNKLPVAETGDVSNPDVRSKNQMSYIPTKKSYVSLLYPQRVYIAKIESFQLETHLVIT